MNGIAILCLVVAVARPAPAEAGPLPTPTPVSARSPRTLGELATRVTLDRSATGQGGGPLVISNDNLAGLAAGGALTTGAAPATPTDPQAEAARARDESALRRRWHTRIRGQRERVAALADRVAALDREVAVLEESSLKAARNQRRGPGGRARLDQARQRRLVAAERLRREGTELESLLRQARQEGAEPGWFR